MWNDLISSQDYIFGIIDYGNVIYEKIDLNEFNKRYVYNIKQTHIDF